MLLQDILDRLKQIELCNPEALQQEAKFVPNLSWNDDLPKDSLETEAFFSSLAESYDIDEITLAHDSDADAYVYVFHP